MNVREMIEEIPIRYPQHKLVLPPDEERSPDVNWFKMVLTNGWSLSITYGRRSFSDNEFVYEKDSKDSKSVEIAIFTPDPEGDFFITEGMMNLTLRIDGTYSGVLGYQSSEQLFAVIDYVAQFDPKPTP